MTIKQIAAEGAVKLTRGFAACHPDGLRKTEHEENSFSECQRGPSETFSFSIKTH